MSTPALTIRTDHSQWLIDDELTSVAFLEALNTAALAGIGQAVANGQGVLSCAESRMARALALEPEEPLNACHRALGAVLGALHAGTAPSPAVLVLLDELHAVAYYTDRRLKRGGLSGPGPIRAAARADSVPPDLRPLLAAGLDRLGRLIGGHPDLIEARAIGNVAGKLANYHPAARRREE